MGAQSFNMAKAGPLFPSTSAPSLQSTLKTDVTIGKGARNQKRHRLEAQFTTMILIAGFSFWCFSSHFMASLRRQAHTGTDPSFMASHHFNFAGLCGSRTDDKDGHLQWLEKHVDPGILYTNMREHAPRKTHLEELVRQTGFFHLVRFQSACPTCSKVDGILLSQIRLLQRVSQEAHEKFVLVLEDDVELTNEVDRSKFLTTLSIEMQNLLNENSSDINSSSSSSSSSKNVAYLGVCLSQEMEALCTPLSCSAFCMHAFMVKPRGARQILQKLTEKHGDVELEEYKGKHININVMIGAPPLLGWNYTHDHVMGGWRGFFYQARKSPWRSMYYNASGTTRRVFIAHELRQDMLGSFVTPTVLLYAVAMHHGWELVILPFAGSTQGKFMANMQALGNKIDQTWGTGYQDASHREDYDPVKLNTDVIDTMGFFPNISETANSREWIQLPSIPLPGDDLQDACLFRSDCYIMINSDPGMSETHMKQMGGFDHFFTEEFRSAIRAKYLAKNNHRLVHYKDGGYHVAIHVRRGDIGNLPARWVDQSVYARVARRICLKHPEAHIHVFSAGKNGDGNWHQLQNVTTVDDSMKIGGKCASVSLHLDEFEFDTWAHMVAADELVMSKSNFGLIPALLCQGEVHYPSGYWHLKLKSFQTYDDKTGESVP